MRKPTLERFLSDYYIDAPYDEAHPLAHVGLVDEDDVLTDSWRLDSVRWKLKWLMKRHGLSRSDLALMMPKGEKKKPKEDGSSGISERMMSKILKRPEIATASQVAALCKVFDVGIDWLRSDIVDWSDRAVEYGGVLDMVYLYQFLDESDRKAVWDHAKALLALHSPEAYEKWTVWDSDVLLNHSLDTLGVEDEDVWL